MLGGCWEANCHEKTWWVNCVVGQRFERDELVTSRGTEIETEVVVKKMGEMLWEEGWCAEKAGKGGRKG